MTMKPQKMIVCAIPIPGFFRTCFCPRTFARVVRIRAWMLSEAVLLAFMVLHQFDEERKLIAGVTESRSRDDQEEGSLPGHE